MTHEQFEWLVEEAVAKCDWEEVARLGFLYNGKKEEVKSEGV